MAMNSMQKKLKSSPSIANSICYCYKWAIRGFWDSQLPQQGIPPGMITGLARAIASHFTISIIIINTKPLWPPLAS